MGGITTARRALSALSRTGTDRGERLVFFIARRSEGFIIASLRYYLAIPCAVQTSPSRTREAAGGVDFYRKETVLPMGD